jgi:pimeloyl-ACP methyl ester carboxylesterase
MKLVWTVPILAVALIAGQAIAPAEAAEVKIRHQGLTLNAELELAPGKTVANGLALMVHSTLAHARMELMQGLQAAFEEKGISTLAINLGLGVSDRHGAYDCAQTHKHRHTDALDEIGAWLAWAKQQDAKDVVLLGYSRGGNQVAWFAAERNDPAIDMVVLVAPMVTHAAALREEYQQRFGTALPPLLARAKQTVAAGQGSALLEGVGFLQCKNARVTAEAFVSYYDADRRLDTTFLLRKIKQPVLVVTGTEDTVVTGLESRLVSMADDQRLKLVVLPGADHMFRHPYPRDIADSVRAFRDQLFETTGEEPGCR